MKRIFLPLLFALSVLSAICQTSDYQFKFYGLIRADMFYNTRANNENIDGMFYLFPKDHNYDPDGNDLNAGAQGYLYNICTRAGVDIKGPNLGEAKTTAKLEADFRGSGNSLGVLRVRHAYVNLAWKKTQLLVGQTWHPLFGEVSPSTLNLSTGAPFQPFNRSPQVRLRYLNGHGIQLTAAAVWQQQYSSIGPNGKSTDYLKNSAIPEVFAGIDYKGSNWQAGVGAEVMSLKPRLNSVVDGKTYKVKERVTSVSVEAHAKYSEGALKLSAKTCLANNLTQLCMLGGFAVTSVDNHSGEMTYTPFRNSTTWINAVYGTKWQGGIFAGYMKNLGTGKAITGKTYGLGVDVDQLFSVSAQLTYNLPQWKLGAEITPSTAWYGTTDLKNGRVTDTHSVTNLRFLIQMAYIF